MHPGDHCQGPAQPHDRPQVSIVIPNHNYARFLPGCLRSIAEQRLDTRCIEIVFVDDESSDGSAELAARLLPDMALAGHRVLCLPRVGRPGPVRNAGLAQARGTALLALDPDDLILPDFLPRCLAALDQGADVAYTDYFAEDRAGRQEVRLPQFHKLLLANQNILCAAALFRREFWDQGARFRQATAYEDWDFWIQLALTGAHFRHLAEPLYVYRFHESNFSFTARDDDATSKARLVLDNAGFFPSWSLAWARGVLRGEPWADPMGRGIIPVLPEQASRPVAV